MDEENLNSWAAQPDVCRCCLSTSGAWDLTASYVTEAGIKEVFSDMLQECYGITLSFLAEWGPSRLVCSLCAGHLRDANSFRKQVMRAEQHFVGYCSARQDPVVKLEDHMIDDMTPLADDLRGNSDVDENSDECKLSNLPINSTLTSTKSNEEHHKRARQNPIKSKRKRKNHKIALDYDSDVPIAELSKRNQPSAIKLKDDVEKSDVKENELLGVEVKVDNCSKDASVRTKKQPVAESYAENRHLRLNIALLLKHTTILPFRYNSKFTCLYCDQPFLFFKQLTQHIYDEHNEINEKDIAQRVKTPKDLIKADLSEIKCKICMEKYKNLDAVIDHLIDTHKKTYHDTKFKPSHAILGFDLSLGKLRCHICGKEFSFFKNLSIHMNGHSNNFVCHVCGKRFVSDHRLLTHVIKHRQTDNSCKQCGKNFRTRTARDYHIRKVHKRSKFKCSECGELFSLYQQRLRHLIDVHNFKRPEYRCKICVKDFNSSSGLRSHVRYSHLKTVEYPCEVCGKIFIHKWTWRRHLEGHSGVKNFACKFCDKRFAKPYTLQVHLRIHLEDKRFACAVCKAAFVQKCSLNNHMRVHHPESVKGKFNLPVVGISLKSLPG